MSHTQVLRKLLKNWHIMCHVYQPAISERKYLFGNNKIILCHKHTKNFTAIPSFLDLKWNNLIKKKVIINIWFILYNCWNTALWIYSEYTIFFWPFNNHFGSIDKPKLSWLFTGSINDISQVKLTSSAHTILNWSVMELS